ncbi:hypothetical protein Nepgr_008413 [Nepenthes gracilis]|uniref:Pentatricopeptide repeat-containing protein n=1 Tax=Nepenthes gracilis TaxID=150966 RepID=A0AAD3S8P3_NEPGR|nr:hypothetical protein Nepgr_008413 [Nepenthes gracilis]
MARVFTRDIFRFRYPSFSSYPALSLSPFSSSSCPNLSPEKDYRPLPLPQRLLILIKQCQSMSLLYQIHAHLITSGLFQNPFFASKLLKISAEFGNLLYTSLIFQNINFPDKVCLNTVIKAYSTSSVPQQGVVFYFEMLQRGYHPNSFTFSSLLSCCAKSVWVKSGKTCHGQVIKNGVDGVVPVGNSLIHMYACCGLIEMASKVFDEMCDRDVVSWNSMVDGFAKVGDLDTAHNLFDKMPDRNVVSWNVMITGYLETNSPGCVLKLFREMTKTEFIGNDKTIVGVLTACGRSARLKEGMSVHGYLVRVFWELNLIINTAMIDMYSKCQKVEVAQRIFDSVTQRNLVCWNAMILGHSIHGKPEDGLDLFAEMVGGTRLDNVETNVDRAVGVAGGQGILPDEITFVGVLCACSRAGLLIKGRTYFSQMINLFFIKPNFAHYWCMANLFASNGLVREALETVRKVTEYDDYVSSETLIWASLLGSCRFQEDLSLGEVVAKSLIELEPQNIMCYALLLNIYAVAGRWEDVARVKGLIKENGGKDTWLQSCRLDRNSSQV